MRSDIAHELAFCDFFNIKEILSFHSCIETRANFGCGKKASAYFQCGSISTFSIIHSSHSSARLHSFSNMPHQYNTFHFAIQQEIF